MKYKLCIAIIIAVLVIAMGIAEQIYVRKTFAEFSEQLEEIRHTPNDEYSYEQITALHTWWSNKHNVLELFLPHVQLNEIEITYGELLGTVETEDYDSATALLNRIQSTSDTLSENFDCRIGNIL